MTDSTPITADEYEHAIWRHQAPCPLCGKTWMPHACLSFAPLVPSRRRLELRTKWCWRCLRRRAFTRRSYYHAPNERDATERGWIGSWKDSRGHRR